MCYLPRMLLLSVPVIVALMACYPPNLEDRTPATSVSDSFEAVVLLPTQADDDRLRRISIKQETAIDLLDGSLTLHDAVERFQLLSETSGGQRQSSKVTVDQLLSFARAILARYPERYEASLAQLEIVARPILNSPDWSE